jgi:hypothetical protein
MTQYSQGIVVSAGSGSGGGLPDRLSAGGGGLQDRLSGDVGAYLQSVNPSLQTDGIFGGTNNSGSQQVLTVSGHGNMGAAISPGDYTSGGGGGGGVPGSTLTTVRFPFGGAKPVHPS